MIFTLKQAPNIGEYFGLQRGVRMPYRTASIYSVNKIDMLVQERRNSSALALELRLSCTNASK